MGNVRGSVDAFPDAFAGSLPQFPGPPDQTPTHHRPPGRRDQQGDAGADTSPDHHSDHEPGPSQRPPPGVGIRWGFEFSGLRHGHLLLRLTYVTPLRSPVNLYDTS